HHGGFALRRKITAETARHVDHAQRRARHVGEHGGGRLSAPFSNTRSALARPSGLPGGPSAMWSSLPSDSPATAPLFAWGASGKNVMPPAAITLVETVTMAARAVSVPLAVSTASARRVSIDFTGVANCTGTPSASVASSAPRPWRQKFAAVRSAALAKSSAEN